MVIKNKIAIVLTSLLLSQTVFALQNTPVKLAFVNNTDRTGTVLVSMGRLEHRGPEVKGSGGQTNWIFNAADYEHSVTIGLTDNGWQSEACFKAEDKSTLADLNILAYQGDTITITFTGPGPEGELYCTCQGSACW